MNEFLSSFLLSTIIIVYDDDDGTAHGHCEKSESKRASLKNKRYAQKSVYMFLYDYKGCLVVKMMMVKRYVFFGE